MERKDQPSPQTAPESQPAPEKRRYEAPRVESVRLSKEAAESLT